MCVYLFCCCFPVPTVSAQIQPLAASYPSSCCPKNATACSRQGGTRVGGGSTSAAARNATRNATRPVLVWLAPPAPPGSCVGRAFAAGAKTVAAVHVHGAWAALGSGSQHSGGPWAEAGVHVSGSMHVLACLSFIIDIDTVALMIDSSAFSWRPTTLALAFRRRRPRSRSTLSLT